MSLIYAHWRSCLEVPGGSGPACSEVEDAVFVGDWVEVDGGIAVYAI